MNLLLGMACVGHAIGCSSNDVAGNGGGGAAGPSADAGDTPPTTISCGGSPCDITKNGCCIDASGASPTFTCASTCSGAAATVKCKSSADCRATETCCVANDSSTGAIVSTCQAGGSCGAQGAILCSPAASDAYNRCGDAGACGNTNISTWNLPKAYGTCGDQPD